ncbi:unannotated protein [freshwater metagenome]|uniref:Unannotated protein n=1 Tax=freshwater metagenome TaxID=449393 RepID=A0A6J7J862_9ZZZZ|nr:NfeD family protein [Actinomycetota bacterium]
MDAWVLWLLATVVLAFGEIATTRLVLGPFALGAVIASFASLGGVGGSAIWILFIVVSLAALVLLRPVARRHLREHAPHRRGPRDVIGRPARVLERVANVEGTGIVELHGVVWNARALEAHEVYETGDEVEVVDVRGATALVAGC